MHPVVANILTKYYLASQKKQHLIDKKNYKQTSFPIIPIMSWLSKFLSAYIGSIVNSHYRVR